MIAEQKILKYDETGYNLEMNYWENKLLPILREGIAAYNGLSIGDFNQETFEDLQRCKFQNISTMEPAYMKAIRKDLKLFKTPTLQNMALDNAEEALAGVRDIFSRLNERSFSLKGNNYKFGGKVQWQHCRIVNGEPVIDKEAMKQAYTITLDNQTEEELFELLTGLQVAYKPLIDFIKAKGIRTGFLGFSVIPQFFTEKDDKSIEINPEAIKNVSFYQN